MLERLAREKQSNLLRKFVTYGCKKFYNIGPWSQPSDWAKSGAPLGQSLMLPANIRLAPKTYRGHYPAYVATVKVLRR